MAGRDKEAGRASPFREIKNMSRTKHRKEYTKHRIRGRGNPYGLCPCAACRAGRSKSKGYVEKIKHKFRTCWKTNKNYKKGIYTD